MPQGFLFVLSDPGEQVPIDQFQDWYDNEHVPLRMNHLRSFLAGARYTAADKLKPSWLAVYDIDDTASFAHESYTRLRTNRSAREADVVAKLEVLDRRTCELVYDSGVKEGSESSSFRLPNPSGFVYTHGVEVGDDKAFGAWAEKTFEELRGVKGWLRSSAYKVFDSLKMGTSVPDGPEAQVVPKYLVVHELANGGVSGSDAFEEILGDGKVGIVEERRWELYRAYPGIAQGNLR